MFPDIQTVLVRIPALLIGLTLHELAHAWVAYRLGDPTAKNMGRLTLNPLKHLDVAGTIFLIIFGFGWAKPVPINPFHFKGDRQKGVLWVSLAGPLTNLVIAVVTALVWKVVQPQPQDIIIGRILFEIFLINIVLAVFNIIPVPPLDGSKILAGILPARYGHVIYNLEKYGFILLMFLMLTGITGAILTPAIRFVAWAITTLLGVQGILM